MTTFLAVVVFAVAIPFAITLGIGSAMAICDWLYRRLGGKS